MLRFGILLTACFSQVNAEVAGCSAKRFLDAVPKKTDDDYIIYGLTQDCQLFFARSYQLDYLSRLQIDLRNNYCAPAVIQLHVLSANTLLLLMRQGPKRICTLELSIPPPQILFGSQVFKYPLQTAMRFLVCSHSDNFALEPTLSFFDTAFQDVMYSIDVASAGPQWHAKQLLLKNGSFSLLSSVSFDHNPSPSSADALPVLNFAIGSEPTRKSLFVVNRQSRQFTKSCIFDMLFRPHALISETGTMENPFGGGAVLHSVAAEGDILLLAEEKRAGHFTTSSFIYLKHTSDKSDALHCIAQLDYAVNVGIVRISTLRKLEKEPLPKFSPHLKHHQHSHHSHFKDHRKIHSTASTVQSTKEESLETNRVATEKDNHHHHHHHHTKESTISSAKTRATSATPEQKLTPTEEEIVITSHDEDEIDETKTTASTENEHIHRHGHERLRPQEGYFEPAEPSHELPLDEDEPPTSHSSSSSVTAQNETLVSSTSAKNYFVVLLIWMLWAKLLSA